MKIDRGLFNLEVSHFRAGILPTYSSNMFPKITINLSLVEKKILLLSTRQKTKVAVGVAYIENCPAPMEVGDVKSTQAETGSESVEIS